jgi:hypothetical protein
MEELYSYNSINNSHLRNIRRSIFSSWFLCEQLQCFIFLVQNNSSNTMEKDLRHDEDPELSEDSDSENEEDDGGDPSDDDLSEPRFRHAVEKAAATKFAIEDFYENFSKHLKERTDR